MIVIAKDAEIWTNLQGWCNAMLLTAAATRRLTLLLATGYRKSEKRCKRNHPQRRHNSCHRR